MDTLSLDSLSLGLPALTAHAGGFLAEAASVCLAEVGHVHPATADFSVTGDHNARYWLAAVPVTAEMRACHDDLQDATEHGRAEWLFWSPCARRG